ncbi:MAG: M48 family metallopeptidase [Planctomycetes bacterium]|nr:M48 family metallopeptidase [Planctomycetota bacterium]
MEHLVHIVLAVFALAAAEMGARVHFELPGAVALLALVPYALGTYSRALYLRGRFRLSQWLWRSLHWCSPVLFAIAVCVFGWAATIERWTGASTSLLGWPEPGLLLALAPFVFYALAVIDVRVRHTEPDPATRAASRRFQSRMLISALVPMTVFALGAWLVGRQPAWRVGVEHVGLYGLGFVVVSVGLFTLALPWILRASWDTQPLEPSPLRSLLEDVARHARFRYRQFALWRTGDMLANAAVVGLGPFDRVVLFSDVLLSTLSPREVVAVLAHEIGHAKRHHVVIFVTWTGAVFLAGDLVGREFESEWIAGGIVLALFVAWHRLFGWLSRRFELEADLFALRLTRDPSGIIGALDRVGGAHSRQLDSWRHFSTAKRIAFVEAVAADERVGVALERRLRTWTWIGVVACVLALGVSIVRLAGDLPRDRVSAALALGEWDHAAALAERLGEPTPELSRWLELVAKLDATERTKPDAAVTRSRSALAAGEPKLALDWLTLELHSGRREQIAAADVLADYVEAEAADLAEGRLPTVGPLEPRCADLDPAWRAAAAEHDRHFGR